MNLNKTTWMAFLSAAVMSLSLSSQQALAADPAVKKSDSGICHDSSSPSYANTKKFTPFNSMDECIKSGGTAPKNAKAPEPAAPAVVIKKSDSGICHDPSSPSYEKTKKFTPFNSMDECIKSGGKAPKK
jgi:hypothetical protein